MLASSHRIENLTAKKWLPPFFGFGLSHVPASAPSLDRKFFVIGHSGKAATAYNEHIAKIAALPRGINILLFLQPLLALKVCWEAATTAICHYVSGKRRTAQ
jgi:hypothetical protein